MRSAAACARRTWRRAAPSRRRRAGTRASAARSIMSSTRRRRCGRPHCCRRQDGRRSRASAARCLLPPTRRTTYPSPPISRGWLAHPPRRRAHPRHAAASAPTGSALQHILGAAASGNGLLRLSLCLYWFVPHRRGGPSASGAVHDGRHEVDSQASDRRRVGGVAFGPRNPRGRGDGRRFVRFCGLRDHAFDRKKRTGRTLSGAPAPGFTAPRGRLLELETALEWRRSMQGCPFIHLFTPL